MMTAGETQIAPASFPEAPSAITCEREFLAALRARREELQIGYETIEALCDMPRGYASKLLSPTSPRAMGALTMWLILRALGYAIHLVEDPAALARNQRHYEWQKIKRPARKRRWSLPDIAIARRRNAPWLLDSEKAREIAKKSHEVRRKNQERLARITARNRANALKGWQRLRAEKMKTGA